MLKVYKRILIFFLCTMLFFKFADFKKQSFLSFQMPPKRLHATYSFYNQQCCLVSYWILFICAPFTGKRFMLERSGLSLKDRG